MSQRPGFQRRIRRLVVDVALVAADPAAGHAADDLVRGHVDVDREVDLLLAVGERVVERLRLRPVAREAVEDRARGGVGLVEPAEQHADRDVVGDQLTALHEPARLETDRRAVPDGGPEQVAGGHVRDPELLGQQRRLRPLAGARRPEQHEDGHRTCGDSPPSPDEAFVVAHHQLRLDLLHRLDHDGHHDQQAGAA